MHGGLCMTAALSARTDLGILGGLAGEFRQVGCHLIWL
jgi:hypothetical protein